MLVEENTNVARFYKCWKQNNFQSEKQGKLVGEEVDYIEIRTPKDKLNVFKRLATAQDKSDYTDAWELYQRGPEQAAEGTPLREWPVMTETTISMLNSYDIHTVEALADLSDAGLYQIGQGARQLQRGAKLFLEEIPSKAVDTSAESADLRVENERLAAKITELETKTAEQREKIKRQAKKIGAFKSRKAA